MRMNCLGARDKAEVAVAMPGEDKQVEERYRKVR
jgi:hypothetical protein